VGAPLLVQLCLRLTPARLLGLELRDLNRGRTCAVDLRGPDFCGATLPSTARVPSQGQHHHDDGSGVAGCKVSVTGGQPNRVGTFNFTVTATDKAGNTTTQTRSYKVIFKCGTGSHNR
jgi:hypothetical protein